MREKILSPEDKSKQPTIVCPEPLVSQFCMGTAIVWISNNFSEDWFSDALNDAMNGTDHNARRREVIFATSFLETFIFELARKNDIAKFQKIFPTRGKKARKTLKEKWKEVPSLLNHGRKVELDLSQFGILVKYRNGLIHASSSRPLTKGLSNKEKPFPTKDDLRKLKAGWAVLIAINLVSDLLKQLNLPIPSYIEQGMNKMKEKGLVI